MKKVFSFVMIFAFALLLPVYAQFSNPPITDGAGYLTDAQFAELSAKLDEIRQTYDFEVAIYTETDMTSDSAEESADDIYDYGNYGAGETADGILLYICSGTREYHFTTCGKGITAFNSNGLIYLENKVLPYLSEDDFYGAFKAYAETSQELLELASQGTPFDENQYSSEYLVGVVAACLLIPLLIAFLMMRSKLKKMKTATENDYATNYIKPGSMNLTVSRDMFLFSHITKTEKPKSNSGTHTSSSGQTHGGRGGSF